MKTKAAFIDHSFHKKTLSTVFLKEVLSKTFDLVEYFDESWGGNEIDINTLKKYEYIFYFQFIHEAYKLKSLNKNAKIIWFPMWDAVSGMKNTGWLKYQTTPIKIVCFSKTLYTKLSKLGFDCAYFQYFIDPQSVQPVTDYNTARVYYWNRIGEINWGIVKKLLGNNHIASLTYMAVPDDPNHQLQIPPEDDQKKYNIQLYDQFLCSEDYINLVSKSNIYIAPRMFEGIGMTFIEALCRGQCVIAPNFSTMNEYIVHGENGYLYDLDKIEEITINNFESVGKEARARALDGFKNWEQQKSKLVEYVSDLSNMKRKSKTILFVEISFFKIQEFAFALMNKIIRMISFKLLNFRK